MYSTAAKQWKAPRADLSFLVKQHPVWKTPYSRMSIDIDYAVDPHMPLLSPRVAAVLALLFADDKRSDVALIGFTAKVIMLQLYTLVPREEYTDQGLLPEPYFDEEYADDEKSRNPHTPLWLPSGSSFQRWFPPPSIADIGSWSLVQACVIYEERDMFHIALAAYRENTEQFHWDQEAHRPRLHRRRVLRQCANYGVAATEVQHRPGSGQK